MLKWFRYDRSADDARVLAAVCGGFFWPLAVLYLDSRRFPKILYSEYTIMAYAWAFLFMAPIGAILAKAVYTSLWQPRTQKPPNFLAAIVGFAFAAFMCWLLPRLMNDEKSFLDFHRVPYDLSPHIVVQRYLIWLLPPLLCSCVILWRGFQPKTK